MTASELRLGNLVKVGKNALHSDGGSKEIYEISELKKDVVHFKGFHAGEFYKDIEPIPLTEEWLLKFGFRYITEYSERYDGFAYVLDLGFIIIGNGVMGGDIIIFNSERKSTGKTIEYVHQLQNLFFALTGEELKLKDETQ